MIFFERFYIFSHKTPLKHVFVGFPLVGNPLGGGFEKIRNVFRLDAFHRGVVKQAAEIRDAAFDA